MSPSVYILFVNGTVHSVYNYKSNAEAVLSDLKYVHLTDRKDTKAAGLFPQPKYFDIKEYVLK